MTDKVVLRDGLGRPGDAERQHRLAQWRHHGFGAYVGMLLDKDVGVVVLTNESQCRASRTRSASGRSTGCSAIPTSTTPRKLKARRQSSRPPRSCSAKPANPRPFPPLAPLAGNFANPSFGKAALRLDGDALVLDLRGPGAQLKLEPWDGDVFTVQVVARGGSPPWRDQHWPASVRLRPAPDRQGRQARRAPPVVRRWTGLRIPPRVAAFRAKTTSSVNSCTVSGSGQSTAEMRLDVLWCVLLARLSELDAN